MRIDYKLIDLSKEKIKEHFHSYLDLQEDHLRFSIQYIADTWKDSDDESLGWDENELHSYEVVAKRQAITGVTKLYLTATKVYKISIMAKGFGNDIDLYFKRDSEATEIQEKIVNWMLDK